MWTSRKKIGQYLEVYFQNVVFTVYAQFFLLNLGYIEPKFEQFLGETSRYFTCFDFDFKISLYFK
jgi:hypothetical protein